MLRVRRGKLPLLAAAVGATLPTLGFGQTNFNWTFNNGGPSWTADWNTVVSTSAINWSPNNLGVPGTSIALSSKVTFPVAAIAGGAGTVTLPAGFGTTVVQMDFVGTGTLAGGVDNRNYTLVGPGTLSIAMGGTGTIDVTSAGTVENLGYATISAALSTGTGNFLTKTGTGTLVLAGANTFRGGLAINGGVVSVSNAAALNGMTILSTANNGALELRNTNIATGTTLFAGIGAGLGAGTNLPSNGMIYTGAGDNTWNGSWFLVGRASAGALAGGKLTLNGALIDSNDTAVNGFTKQGAGTFAIGSISLIGPLGAADGTLATGVISAAGLSVGSVVTDTNPLSPTFTTITFQSAGNVTAGVVTLTSGGGLTMHKGTATVTSLTSTGPMTIGRLDSTTFTTASFTSTGSVTAGNITVTSGSLTASRIVSTGSMSIGADTKVKLTPNGTTVANQTAAASTVKNFTMAASAQLDLTNNKLTIDYTGNPSPAAAIRALLLAGRTGGTWKGATGIMSSTLTQTSPAHYAIGYEDKADPSGPQNVVVAYTRIGDANIDGVVNAADLLRVSQNYNGTSRPWYKGDFNYDGIVNASDLLIVSQNYNGTLPSEPLPGMDLSPAFLADWQAILTSSAVPEPGSAGLLLLGGAALLGKRKRRS